MRIRIRKQQQENTMTRKQALAAVVAGVVATGAAATVASSAFSTAWADDALPKGFAGAALAKDAKVSLTDARAIALKVFGGEIVAEELEKERGGSGLRYSFDIKNGQVTREVGVDAKTGKLLENSVEGAHHD
jgi:uncharacterized membrane protein YkoI